MSECPQILCGPKPQDSFRKRIDEFVLAAGEKMEFIVPENEYVRVDAADGCPLDSDSIEIWMSNGSAMFRQLPCAISDDRHSLFAAPHHANDCVIRIRCPANAKFSRRIAVFVSRHETPQLLDAYQCELDGCECRVEVRDDRANEPVVYSVAEGDTQYRLKSSPTQRIRIESRLLYSQDPEQRQSYWIEVHVDGVLQRLSLIETSPERHRRVFVDDRDGLVGQPQYLYVDLPHDHELVEIIASHRCLLRVTAASFGLGHRRLNQNFALPSSLGLAPASPPRGKIHDSLSAEIESVDAFSPSRVDDKWSLIELPDINNELLVSANRTGQFLGMMLDPWDAFSNQGTIRELARDNASRHGGLDASMWSRAIASRHWRRFHRGRETDVSQFAHHIQNHYTYFRNLAAATPSSVQPRTCLFTTRRLKRRGEGRTEWSVANSHLRNALGGLSEATTFDIRPGKDQSVSFPLPDSMGVSELRLIVDQTGVTAPCVLVAWFDEGSPFLIQVDPCPPVDESMLSPNLSDAAFTALSSVHADYDRGVAGGPFGMFYQNLPVIKTATCEFMKPAEAKRLHLQLLNGPLDGVAIAIQARDHRKTKLSERSFLRFQEILHRRSPESLVSQFADRELNNDAVSLRQFLAHQHRNLLDSVVRSAEVDPPANPWEHESGERMVDDVESLIEREQYASAVDRLSVLIRNCDGDIRSWAILRRVDTLLLAGEAFLANRELRGWLCFSSDATLRDECLHRLLELDSNTPFLRIQYAAFAAYEFASSDHVNLCARELMNSGRHRWALILALANDQTPSGHETILRCSLQLQWWRTFDDTVAMLTDDTFQHLWMGHKAARQGRYTQAKSHYQHAGAEGEIWLRHWRMGETIVAQAATVSPDMHTDLLSQWCDWQSSHPGPKGWRIEPSLVRSAAGVVDVYSKALDTSTSYFRIAPAQDSTITVIGPVRLRVQLRPLHQSGVALEPDDEPAMNGWATLHCDGLVQRIPITRNQASQTLAIVGQPTQKPGGLISTEVLVPAGRHVIAVTTDTFPALFRVLALRPEIRSPVLPVISDFTVSHLLATDHNPSRRQRAFDRDRVRLLDQSGIVRIQADAFHSDRPDRARRIGHAIAQWA